MHRSRQDIIAGVEVFYQLLPEWTYTLSPELVDGLTQPLSRECRITTHTPRLTYRSKVGVACGFAESFETIGTT
jgi:hypothetical protein